MPGPPLSRRQVAATLRQLREAADLTRTAAGAVAGLHQTTMSRFEQGRHVPNDQQMTLLLDQYAPDSALRARLMASTRRHQTGKQQQVVMHADATTVQNRIGAAEKAATRVVTFSPLLVPGLVQSPSYARAVGATQLNGEALDSWVAARLARQASLTRPGGTRYELYTAAGALTWALGGRDVMLEQIAHLVDATRADTYQFGIVPAGCPTHLFPLHAIDLTETPESRLVAFGTHTGGSVTVTAAPEQAEALALLDEVERIAVTGEAARDELDRLADLYRAG